MMTNHVDVDAVDTDNTVDTGAGKTWMFLVGIFLVLIAVGIATS